MHFYNVRHMPLLEGDGLLLHRVALPSLHLLIGITDFIIKNLIESYPMAEEWPSSLHLVWEEQHGGKDFNGNGCSKLLKSTEKLRSLKRLRKHAASVSLYADALDSFGGVVKACFGAELDPGYEEKIDHFKKAFLKLNLSITPKVRSLNH